MLNGFVTPRNIVFAPSGNRFYVSDSSLGTVTRYDLAMQQPRAVVTGFAQQRQGVRLSPDG